MLVPCCCTPCSRNLPEPRNLSPFQLQCVLSQSSSSIDIFIFALQLEYLEADFYWWAVYVSQLFITLLSGQLMVKLVLVIKQIRTTEAGF